MPSVFDQSDADLARFVLTSDLFAELLVYKPAGGGTPRTFYGIVDRSPPERIGPDGAVYTPKMEITAANDAASGIAATEIDNGGDAVSVAYRLGDAAADHLIVGEPLSIDAAMIRVAVL